MDAYTPAAPPGLFSQNNRNFGYKIYIGLGALIFIACLIGTLTRPFGALAAIWPANALLLGLFTRFPALGRSGWAWAWAALAFVLSGLVMRDPPVQALLLALTNLAGIASGHLFFRQLPPAVMRMREDLSPLYLLCGSAIAAATAAVAGSLVGPLMFATSATDMVYLWFTGELLNYMLLMPLVLTVALPAQWRAWGRSAGDGTTPLRGGAPAALGAGHNEFNDLAILPALTVLVAELLGSVLGGPGALLFSVPALLWCAMRYSLFTTSVLTLLVCLYNAIAISQGLIAPTNGVLSDVVSLRLGLTLLALGPLAVACVVASRDDLLARLDYAAQHDGLTGALSRAAWLRESQRVLDAMDQGSGGAALMMLDLDHFKAINDEHGQAAGDGVLRSFALLLHDNLREQDVLGRTGGEQFAVMLPYAGRAHALTVAQRLCDATRENAFELARGMHLPVTVSVGVVHVDSLQAAPQLERLLHEAEQTLAEAKERGRDRIVLRGHART